MGTRLRGTHFESGKGIEIHFENGVISNIVDVPSDESFHRIAPGLVDLQVNGYKGIDFNSGNLTKEEVAKVVQCLWEVGVTTFYPTLITNSDENIKNALRAIVEACEEDKLVNGSIGGIHLEGPFLSAEEGPRGAHPLEHIKDPDWELFKAWQEYAKGRIKLITLAPEREGTYDFIEKCAASGVLVSIGHTEATPEQIKDAVKAGARMSTHLGNAAHLNLPRHPNYIWEQLASDDLWISLIADGFHLPESVLKVFIKVKPENSVLVSDCTQFAGLPPGTYTSHIGGAIELGKEGRLFMKKNPRLLAGSAQSLVNCIDHLVNSGLVPLSVAWRMASEKPLELMNVQSYGLSENGKVDLVVFERRSNTIEIVQTIKSGRVVYPSSS
ncbi:amidohydrolase family protein [Flagellimonas olearia]|uniref:Amidohydrolase family protein n=1 Tax=Flagellimonas olearia TaxID=552546 RepID=A0A6I1DWH4_9FLAO|nr:amidohydrolase family protein [Allomuricauda olearia]KAB7528151.1 amidohydrolase family protein [Allomuricauda olearia]